jgi:sugar/nucleoside kinase (ribokinase family)
VKAIDTIAAGDTFNGALVTALLEGKRMMSYSFCSCRCGDCGDPQRRSAFRSVA